MGGIMVLLLLIITLHVNLGHGDANMTMRCTDKEREALLAFKQGLIMDEHSQVLFSSWGTEAAKQDCCRWEGVSCDNQTGHVLQLDLNWLPRLSSLTYLGLSFVNFSGSQLPYFIGSLTNLGHLDLSGCVFGGKIPTGTQLQSFDPSFYDGNPQLCGPPLKKPCDIEETSPDQVSNEEDKDGQLIRYGFYISMVLGFFVGFWGVCGSLIFIREWRYTYFKFLNSLNDWLYVRVVLIKRKLTDAQ
ncbi:unnamed protein product [Malus baccata var. baccata]